MKGPSMLSRYARTAVLLIVAIVPLSALAAAGPGDVSSLTVPDSYTCAQ